MKLIFIILTIGSLHIYFQNINIVADNILFSYKAVKENLWKHNFYLTINSAGTDSVFLCKKYGTGNLEFKNISGEDIKVYITNLQVLVRNENKYEFRIQSFPYYPISNGKVLSLNNVKVGNYKVKLTYRKSSMSVEKLIDVPMCENTLQFIENKKE